MLDWLPALVLLTDHNGSWDPYLEAIYAHFRRDFITSIPSFKTYRMGLKRYPTDRNKEATFWHLISEGEVEAERTPDLRRCERICWPRPMIEEETTRQLKVWRQTRKTEKRVAIGLPDFSYIMVLAERMSGSERYYLPWTAFCVEHNHQRRKFQKEWETNPYTG